jgi:AGCS family alanine or glycine:cation symporter
MLGEIIDTLYNLVWETPSWLPWLAVMLLGTGLFITLRLGFIQLRRVGHAIRVVQGKYDDPADEGDINHFQALTTALSATVGIAGVATAIHYGGPGALFWMWVTAGLGMALKYSECTLALHYRSFDEAGFVAGGPMYYIEKGLGPRFKWMAIAFAFLAICGSFGSGNMNQANTVAVSARTDFGIPDWITGLVVAGLVAAVILGGIRRIGQVTSKVMPTMAILYAIGSMIILVLHAGEVPGAFAEIFRGAFTPEAGFGGSAAGVFTVTLLWGVKRGLFSNESGQGSAPIAHAAAKTKEPVREGAVALLEPFIDTLIICTMTGLVIVIGGVWDEHKPDEIAFATRDITVHTLEGMDLSPDVPPDEQTYAWITRPEAEAFEGTFKVEEGKARGVVFQFNDCVVKDALLVDAAGSPYAGSIDLEGGTIKGTDGGDPGLRLRGGMIQNSSALTAWAFNRGLEGLFPHGNLIVTFSVFLFALSTCISWSYYGDRCVDYLFGHKWVFAYRLLFVGFTFLGANLALETVWTIGDIALGLMTVPNLIAVIALSGVVVRLTRDYFSREHRVFK